MAAADDVVVSVVAVVVAAAAAAFWAGATDLKVGAVEAGKCVGRGGSNKRPLQVEC